MPSAIELYRDAYYLDFHKGDLEGAESLYKKIIEKFPRSEEKQWAEIHLERIEQIKSGDDSKLAAPPAAKLASKIHPLTIVNFFLIIFTLAALGSMGYWFYLQNKNQKYNELLLSAFQNQHMGKVNSAVACYKKACYLIPTKALAFTLWSEMYLSQNDFDMASKVIDIWRELQPAHPHLPAYSKRLEEAKSEYDKQEAKKALEKKLRSEMMSENIELDMTDEF